MHQTFYIDIDEEITSVVERLKKARTEEIIMVIPKRALLIQSIVNLRILKKEADEAGLQLMIVTQDKLGKILIEKAGILVQNKMENISDEEIDLREEKNLIEKAYSLERNVVKAKKDGRLNEIGSQTYYNETDSRRFAEIEAEKMKRSKKLAEDEKENLINMELVTEIGKDIKKEKAAMDLKFDKSAVLTNADLRREFSPDISQDMPRNIKNNFGSKQDEKIENFFHHSENFEERRKKTKKNETQDFNIPSKTHSRLWLFVIILAVVVFGITAYIFIPKTNIIISTKSDVKSIDSEIIGDVSAKEIDYEKSIIPARLMVVEGEAQKTADATGSKTVSNQKARGTITIYNEYSQTNQPLVATTRFLTGDGKLFRLTSAVIVPGTSKSSDGQIKPGSIEAQVAADQPGEEYNIGPAEFKIPGFQSSGDKYNKIYAKSEKTMSGGGHGTGESKFVRAEDIAKAKDEALAKAKESIKQKISASAGDEVMIIDGAIKEDEAVYKLSNLQDDVVDSFQVTVQMKASVLIFNKKDFYDVAGKMIAAAGNADKDVNSESLVFTFGKPSVDFEKGTMDIKFNGSGKLNPKLDLDALKTEILGKKENDLEAYLNTFPDIEKAEISYWPSFIKGRIPFCARQVNLSLDNK